MSTNENNLPADSDFNKLTTTTTTAATINSFLSTTTAISNVSLLHTSLSAAQQKSNRTLNITLLISGISAGIILIIIIICAFVKYRNRDEGSYKIDESKNFVSSSHADNHDNTGCGGKPSHHHHRQKLLKTDEQNGIDSREWYV